VRAYYQEGCVSDSSNHVIETIGEETCEPVNDLVAEKMNDNSILLTWTEPEEDLEIEGFHLFRNEQLLMEELLTETSYLDENLPSGSYEYYIITHYTNDCISNPSNHVEETIELGIKEIDNGIAIYPNPTTGELIIESGKLKIENIEIFDLMGRSAHPPLRGGLGGLSPGIYFIRITTEKNVFIKKTVKY